MRISSLSVRNVGRHREGAWDLDPGLTVVSGPNEAGKSTLQRALELVLTRPATSTSPDIAALRTWGAEGDEPPGVAIAFEWDEEDGSVHQGRLAKVFAGAAGTTRLELDGILVADPAQVEARFAELSGLPTEGFLRSTASVRQSELAGLQQDEAALRERLAASISGADRGTARARRRVDEALADLAPRNGGPGRLGTAAEAVADAERRLASGEEGLARLERDREAHTIARERRAAAEAALTERRSQLEKAREAERLHALLDDARGRLDRYSEAIELRDQLAELDTSHPSPMPLTQLAPAVERLRALETRIATLEELLSDEVTVDFDLPPERNWDPLGRVGLAVAGVGLVLAIAGAAARVAAVSDLWPVPLALGVVLVIAGAVVRVVALRNHRADRATRQMKDEEVARRLRGRSDMEVELRRTRTLRDEAIEGLDLPGIAEAEERLAAETAHVARIDQGRARLAGLIGDEDRESLPAKRDAATADIERTTAGLDALGPIGKEPHARERLEVEVRDAEGVADRARDDESVARARVEQNPVDAEDVAGLAERLASWRADLADLRRQERILRRTLAELDAAEQTTMARATRFLERRMAADVARLTGGRYSELRIEDTTLGIEVRSAERGDWVPLSQLSRGTLDTVYLAARLGLVRLVTGDRRPPLLLDDPLVSLDDERAGQAFGVLRELTADFQVVYLTIDTRYHALADTVIELAAPASASPVTVPAGRPQAVADS